MKSEYSAPIASIVPKPTFEKAVVKIQSGLEEQLSAAEKDKVSMLRENVEESASQSDSSSTVTMAERLLKKRKTEVTRNQYTNCDFILGSVAEVERLWSISKYVFRENRRSLTPQLFEAVMFLKVNQRFWDAQCSTSRFREYVYTVATRARTKGNESTPHVKRSIT